MNGIEVNELIPFAVNHCDEPILSFSQTSGWRVVHATLVWYPSQLCRGVMFMPNTPPSWYPRTTQSFLDWDIMLTVLPKTLSDHIKISRAGVSPLVSLPMLGEHWNRHGKISPAPVLMSTLLLLNVWARRTSNVNGANLVQTSSMTLLDFCRTLWWRRTLRTVNTNSLGSVRSTPKVPWLSTNMSALAGRRHYPPLIPMRWNCSELGLNVGLAEVHHLSWGRFCLVPRHILTSSVIPWNLGWSKFLYGWFFLRSL